MFDKKAFIDDCTAIRSQSPLVHNITNYVAMNVVANGLLAIGASPLMSFCPEEMSDLVSSCSALAVNIGCLDSQLVRASGIAAATASKTGKKWVLDPVGAGASRLRTEVACDLAAHYAPTVIRGNESEILNLAFALGLVPSGTPGPSRGVDSSFRADASCEAGSSFRAGGFNCFPDGTVEAAKKLAESTGAVVSMSGPVDFIVDSGGGVASCKGVAPYKRVVTIANGSPLMPRVTALGCTATAITAAFLAVEEDSFVAATNAMALMGVAGEIAATDCSGTGSFAVSFLDVLSTFDAQVVAEKVRGTE